MGSVPLSGLPLKLAWPRLSRTGALLQALLKGWLIKRICRNVSSQLGHGHASDTACEQTLGLTPPGQPLQHLHEVAGAELGHTQAA
jgi:hypothetical protein